MPLSLIVPPQPANPAHLFSFTLVQSGTTRQYTLNKNLAENTVADLRLLVKKIGLSGMGYMKKEFLARRLQAYIFFTTHEEAAAELPILDEPLATTERDLRDQMNRVGYLVGTQPYKHFAHLCKKQDEVTAAWQTAHMEEEREREREKGKAPPLWWQAGDFVKEEDWDTADAAEVPYLKVVVDVIERSHDGYCSGVEEDEDGNYIHFGGGEVEIEETAYRMIGRLPLKDANGAAWQFQGPTFDPLWRCASGGSGVCDVGASVTFVSMERVE
jgi:hypothetical protein